MKTIYLSLVILLITGCVSTAPNIAEPSTQNFCNTGGPVRGTVNQDWELLKTVKANRWKIGPCPGVVHDAFEDADEFNIVGKLNHPNSLIQELEITKIIHLKGGSAMAKREIKMFQPPFNRARVIQGHANIMAYFFVPEEPHVHLVTFDFEKKEDGSGFGFTYRVSPIGEDSATLKGFTHNDYGGGTSQ